MWGSVRSWLSRRGLPSPLICFLLLVAGATFVCQCVSLGEVLIDDAYITFSYSKNLALGNGAVYSHGVRSEGYSNFLWMVLVALPLTIARHIDPVVAARIVGVPFVVFLGWGTYRLVLLGSQSPLVAALAVVVLSSATDFASAYLSGLETVAYTAFFAASLALLMSSWREGYPRARTLAAWCALGAALTRIDGFVVIALLMGLDVGRTVLLRRKLDLRALGRWLGPPLAAYVCWFALRFAYYGLPLPSTYYAKALIPKLVPDRGFNYVRDEIISGGFLLAGLTGPWLLARRRTWALPPLLTVLVQLCYVVRIGGDWMPFGRFVLPVVPFMVALIVGGLAEVVAAVPRQMHLVRVPLAFLMCGMGLVVCGRLDHRWWNDVGESTKLFQLQDQVFGVRALKRAAVFLNEAVPPGGRLATDFAGIYAYYTDAAIIDMLGLATPAIATRGGVEGIQPEFGRTCPECYPELDPEFFHVNSPWLRPVGAFNSAAEVVASVWQSNTIGRYLNFTRDFAVGRVTRAGSAEALYFLEKRRPSFSVARRSHGSFRIDYPFENAATGANDP